MRIHLLARGFAALMLAIAAAIPARAAVVTFDDLTPNIFGTGDSFQSGGQFGFSLVNGFGTVDTAASLSVFGNAPTGNNTQFFAGFNDAQLTMQSTVSAVFSVSSFKFGFIPPVPLPGSASPGYLVTLWTDFGGNTGISAFDLGSADSAGDWAFLTANAAAPDLGTAMTAPMQSITFLTCILSGTSCVAPADNLGQFAIDDVVAQVPEPSTWALMSLGLLGLAAAARRRPAR